MNKIFKSKKQKIKEECWNLNYELVKWINEHFKVYLEDSSKIVDLQFYKFKYKNKEYTQQEIIKMIIEITDELLTSDYEGYDKQEMLRYSKKQMSLVNKMYDLLKLVHWNMWW